MLCECETIYTVDKDKNSITNGEIVEVCNEQYKNIKSINSSA